MIYRHLGRSGLRVSALSLGSWMTYGTRTADDVALECMAKAFEAGVNFFDTAETYANGEAEAVLGRVLKKLNWKRKDYVISTKIFWGGSGPNDRGLNRKHVVEGVRASLERLQLDYVDLVFAHRYDPWTPMEEIVRSFNHIIDKGLAFYWGTSEWTAAQIMEATAVAQRLNLIPPLMEQPQYNMFCRDRVEKEYDPLYKSMGLGTTIWSPLASGVLTGKYNDIFEKGAPEGSRLAMDHWMSQMLRTRLLEVSGKERIPKTKELGKIAAELGCTTAQMAIAWCLKNENVSTVILGASNVGQLEENLKALDILPMLTPEVMERIEGILVNKPDKQEDFRGAP